MSSEVVVRRSSAGRTFLVLLLGLVLGAAAAVAVLALDLLPLGDDADVMAAESPEPSADPTPAQTPAGDVPPSCLASAQYNASVSASLDDVAVGVRDQDALAVEEGLDAIAKIKPDMDAQSEECRRLAGDDTLEDGTGDASGGASDDATDEPTTEPGSTEEPSPTVTP